MAPPKRPPPRELRLMAKQQISENLLRVTIGGEELSGFPEGQEGGYIKFNLPSPDKPGKKCIRTYTIRAQREGELDVDFALHAETATGHAGPATEWALTSKVGDGVPIQGPGAAKPLPQGAGFYIIAGDMTSLPAIAVNLENLAAEMPDAKGIAIIEVMSENDKQEDLPRPAGVDLQWIVNPQPGMMPEALPEAVRAVEWTEGQVYAWVACEFSGMKALRAYLKDERGLGPDRLYISSYWKSGLNEEAHKLVKREDAEAQ